MHQYCTAIQVTDDNVKFNAFWVPKATNTQSEYEILIALPLQHWMQEIASVLCYTYITCLAVAYPGIFFGGGGGGVSTNSVEDRGQRERGSGGGSPLVRGSGGSCNLVQEISFHTVKFS